MQKYANFVELEKCCQTLIFLQNFVLIHPRTSTLKICQFCKCWLLYRSQHRPEPYWFPPLTIVMLTAITGTAVGLEAWAVEAGFDLALAFFALVFPVVAFRVMRSKCRAKDKAVAVAGPRQAVKKGPYSSIFCF